MYNPVSHELPPTGRLLKATGLAAAVAAALLVTTVLPAEYGIDPTGMGARLGLGVLAANAEAAEPGAAAPAITPPAAEGTDAANAGLAARAEAAFGRNESQTLDAGAVSTAAGALRRDSLSLTLPPGKGAEVKAHLGSGQGMVFQWQATADVAVDMHGERPDVKNAWTSYAVEAAQRESAGTFVAPFEGTHGWYWHNRGDTPVTVSVEVTGFQSSLYRP